MLAHATALVGFLVPVAGHIVGPLIVWLAKRGDSPAIDAHGKESLNFQISMFIYSIAAGILCFDSCRAGFGASTPEGRIGGVGRSSSSPSGVSGVCPGVNQLVRFSSQLQ